MIGDLPAISASQYASTASNLGNSQNAFVGAAQGGTSAAGLGQLQSMRVHVSAPVQSELPKNKKEKPVTRRLVQVFIADPDENVPLEKSLLYSGQQKLTDATDQELFFEIDIKTILETYNGERVKIINKKVKERTEYLEPVKIRDLKMVVVNVATF